jgi:hypothetical protein
VISIGLVVSVALVVSVGAVASAVIAPYSNPTYPFE